MRMILDKIYRLGVANKQTQEGDEDGGSERKAPSKG
jgi:hypothetical protein